MFSYVYVQQQQQQFACSRRRQHVTRLWACQRVCLSTSAFELIAQIHMYRPSLLPIHAHLSTLLTTHQADFMLPMRLCDIKHTHTSVVAVNILKSLLDCTGFIHCHQVAKDSEQQASITIIYMPSLETRKRRFLLKKMTPMHGKGSVEAKSMFLATPQKCI